MSTPIKLKARLDVSAAVPLKETLLSHGDGDLLLDASEVVHVGTLCFQVIMTALKALASTGRTLSITGTSDEISSGLLLLGLPNEILVGERA